VNTNAVALRIAAIAPGIFALQGEHEPRPGLLLHRDRPVTPEDPVKGGEVLVIWAAGLGLTTASDDSQPLAGVPFAGEAAAVRTPISVEIDGEPVEVLSAALPRGALGIYEIRVRLPRELPAGEALRLRLLQGDSTSNVVTFPSAGTANSTIPN
jgi:uncharacterized protein (TIGR03437 family)